MGMGSTGYYGMGGYQNANGMSGLYNMLTNAAAKQVAAEQPSMVEQMLARAALAEQNANVPTLAQLFPYVNTGYQSPQAPMTNNSYGAGRFLGNTQSIPFNFNAPTTKT